MDRATYTQETAAMRDKKKRRNKREQRPTDDDDDSLTSINHIDAIRSQRKFGRGAANLLHSFIHIPNAQITLNHRHHHHHHTRLKKRRKKRNRQESIIHVPLLSANFPSHTRARMYVCMFIILHLITNDKPHTPRQLLYSYVRPAQKKRKKRLFQIVVSF